MPEFHVRFISPLHSNDFQLLCSRYIGLRKLQTPYAFPLFINLSLMKYWRQKISYWTQKHRIYLTRKLQQVNAYMYGTRNNLKKYSAAFQLWNIFFGTHFLHLQTGEMPSCGISSEYALFVQVKKDLKAKI